MKYIKTVGLGFYLISKLWLILVPIWMQESNLRKICKCFARLQKLAYNMLFKTMQLFDSKVLNWNYDEVVQKADLSLSLWQKSLTLVHPSVMKAYIVIWLLIRNNDPVRNCKVKLNAVLSRFNDTRKTHLESPQPLKKKRLICSSETISDCWNFSWN